MAELQRLAGDTDIARSNFLKANAILLTLVEHHPRDPWILMLLTYVHAGLGNRRQATEFADRNAAPFIDAGDRGPDAISAQYMRAIVAARFGDRATAIPLLRSIWKKPWAPGPSDLRFDPGFDRLRGDPEFEKLTHADGR